MKEVSKVADQAALIVEQWLKRREKTISVQNVENDPVFQEADIDLILNNVDGFTYIEVKGDRYSSTGNFFFETDSNLERETPGCFLYTKADWVAYLFMDTGELYMLPMPQTRDWFMERIAYFRQRETHTPTSSGHYTTVGRLVPRKRVMDEVEKAFKVKVDLVLEKDPKQVEAG